MPFISEKFLLQSETAENLYRTYAQGQPIVDYHCHLPARDIAEDHRFRDLTEIWLEGDHYKWRAMRANGIPEKYCTGDATPKDKFLAWARTVPATLRNPLYHWTHLELARYFQIAELLDESTAPAIWERANEQLASPALSAQGILRRFNVKFVCTTDDPAESLEFHEQLLRSQFEVVVLPTFRPDKAMRVDDPGSWNAWVGHLGEQADVEIRTLADLLRALERRHDDFHSIGCRLSDHGLNVCPPVGCGEAEAKRIFLLAREGNPASAEETAAFTGYLMLFFGHLDATKGWTKQLHVGALRNTNSRRMRTLGRDTGFDSIADWPQTEALVAFLDALDREGSLPKTIVYNLNPADDYAFAAAIGNFQDGSLAGKIQYGSGWWFLDQKEGIEWQLNALSNCGLLSRFVGMTTDSRSFMSFPRHEYFRRVLCNLLGDEMQKGLLPSDEKLVGSMVRDICFRNASSYFAFPSAEERSRALLTHAAK